MNRSILLLASASPRRREILEQLRIPHHVIHVPAPEGEDEPQLPGEAAQAYVRRTARDKALRAVDWIQSDRHENLLVASPCETYLLSADTTVILDGEVLGKPLDRQHAVRTLTRLSGRTHEVHTALALYHDGELFESVSVSMVRFATLTSSEIAAYCETDEPMGKAGAYGIQGPAAAFVSHLSGSYTGVMGLPAHETVELLKLSRFL